MVEHQLSIPNAQRLLFPLIRLNSPDYLVLYSLNLSRVDHGQYLDGGLPRKIRGGAMWRKALAYHLCSSLLSAHLIS